MRCLTLAEKLKLGGAEVGFISRTHKGNLNSLISSKGFKLYELPSVRQDRLKDAARGEYSTWLGISKEADATETVAILKDIHPDWLIVDHYAIDKGWESNVRPYAKKIMVIDDLANRRHDCDLLLDQNMVENLEHRYDAVVPSHCVRLLGPTYALVRPEFNRLRDQSLARRAEPKLDRLLVFLGGSDADNETGKVVQGIQVSKREWQHIDVIVGQNHPAIEALETMLTQILSAELHVQTSDMAQLMLQADLAITAGGSVTWEKCTLGLPSLVVISGDNQYPIATRMRELGAQRTLGLAADLTPDLYGQHLDTFQPVDLTVMTASAQSICDGYGTNSVLNTMRIFK